MSSTENKFGPRDGWYARAKAMTSAELPGFMAELEEHPHDYNTICYAVAAAALAAAHAINSGPRGGITGFQAGAIMWEFMGAWNGVKFPARLLRYEDMLYPQYEHSYRGIDAETWAWLKVEAQKKLDDASNGNAHLDVVAHWRSIVAGVVPFGFKVEAR